uniref:Uncharacterized protein n=1 Tax=Meloidogyne incognita TaxID=6306 RepID=A0A914LZK2_MELIC
MTTTNSSQSRSKIISSINNSPTVYLNKQTQIKSSSSLQNYNENNESCSGHPSCPGVSSIHQNHHHHLNNNLRTGRSTHSSFDEGDHSSHLSNAGGGPLRDTYLTEISREWMLMNGAIAPFKNILQQASSIASTPLPNHRPFQSIATPAVAASAVNTASAIMAAGSRIAGAAPFGNNLQKTNEDNEVIGSGGGRLNNFVGPAALKSSCFNLAMSEQNNNNFVCNTNIDTPLTAKSDNLDQQKQIIIIEPDKKLEGRRIFFLYFGIFFVLRK